MKEVDSFNSETGKFTCISGASAPKQAVQAQRAAWCKPRRIHDFQHKKRHRNFSKEVDSLGVGQFSNIQQNAALCSAIISKVHNGAVAVRNGANGCFATVLHPLSFAQKKKASEFRCFLFLVGRGGFEPPKAVPTDLQSAPFGHSGIFPRLELVVGVEPTTC